MSPYICYLPVELLKLRSPKYCKTNMSGYFSVSSRLLGIAKVFVFVKIERGITKKDGVNFTALIPNKQAWRRQRVLLSVPDSLILPLRQPIRAQDLVYHAHHVINCNGLHSDKIYVYILIKEFNIFTCLLINSVTYFNL